MVDNKVLVENKKPTETVQELQENWWEKYDKKTSHLSQSAQSLVNRKSGSDYVSEDKDSYGPTCPDCHWDNPDCSHYLSDSEGGYIPLYLSCPARGCGGDGNQYQWKHYSCGDNMYISAEAYIKCRKCNVPRHWKQWLFKCYLHKGEDVWREADWSEFNYALGMVSKLWENKNPMTRLWIDKIAAKVARDK